MEHEAFRSGQFDTGFVSKYFTPDKLTPPVDPGEEQVAAVLSAWLLTSDKPAATASQPVAVQRSNWKKNRQ
jgi:propionyl-CoA carboxylase alpha chain